MSFSNIKDLRKIQEKERLKNNMRKINSNKTAIYVDSQDLLNRFIDSEYLDLVDNTIRNKHYTEKLILVPVKEIISNLNTQLGDYPDFYLRDRIEELIKYLNDSKSEYVNISDEYLGIVPFPYVNRNPRKASVNDKKKTKKKSVKRR